MKLLGFDTETTGKWDFKARADAPHQPSIVQIAAILWNWEPGQFPKKAGEFSCVIKPGETYTTIEDGAASVHGISLAFAETNGMRHRVAMGILRAFLAQADAFFCHNVQFDSKLVGKGFEQAGMENPTIGLRSICTMTNPKSMELVGISGFKGQYRWPKLIELHEKLFNEGFESAHDAMGDIKATSRCLFELERRGLICL